MGRFIFPKSGHLSQLHPPFFTVNQELSFPWAPEMLSLPKFLFSICFFKSRVLAEFSLFLLFWKKKGTFGKNNKEYVQNSAFQANCPSVLIAENLQQLSTKLSVFSLTAQGN